MNLFDILGPVMVGPSSSHTAGAVRIGYVARHLLKDEPCEVKIGLYGSFAKTGKGHGTDRALIAGILDMHPDDMRIPESFELAEKAGMKRGDIILEIDQIELEKMLDLRKYIYEKEVGERVNIKYIRGNKEYQVNITLAKK